MYVPSFLLPPYLTDVSYSGGSAIGSPSLIQSMLNLAAKQKIEPWIIKRKMDDVNQVVVDMAASKARYRYVLVNEENGGTF